MDLESVILFSQSHQPAVYLLDHPPVSGSSAAVSGAFSATSVEPTKAFPSFDAPTGVITGTAATSNAVQLSGLFAALHANRKHILDPRLKRIYIDKVKKTKEDTDALFKSFSIKPDSDPRCSNVQPKQKRYGRFIAKRSFITGLSDLVGDAAQLLSCATKVIDNLPHALEAPEPSVSEVETLTDALKEIADNLEKEDQKPSISPSESQPSLTQQSTTRASKASTSSSAATSTAGGIICSPDCTTCTQNVVKRNSATHDSSWLDERSLEDRDIFDSLDAYVMDQSTCFSLLFASRKFLGRELTQR
ncbi:MAG: hypothetical protein LQ343_000785 [Gyalolechia ehrenbergii]|nr:MAG: hypothetical protein LQ343_000785 [Gyalolechia ehrenbergii]